MPMLNVEKKAPKKRKIRRKRVAKNSKGLSPEEVKGEPPEQIRELATQIEADGGSVLSAYREPLGSHWQIFAALPLNKVKPVEYQRNLSQTHVNRLAQKVQRLNRFLDPIIAIRSEEGIYETPNGLHRSTALQKLGAKTIMALVIPDVALARDILALNTEKAPNVKEKSLEVIRLARALAQLSPGDEEASYADQFEEAAYLTLGACYEAKLQFSGGAYFSFLRRTEHFFEERLSRALTLRTRHAKRLFELDEKVTKAVTALKEVGLTSPFLKTFVVARINPLRWIKGGDPDFDDTIDTMLANLKKFDPSKIKPHHLSSMAGAPNDE